jgi:hypothetical protein
MFLPLSLYLLYLGFSVNRRPHPYMLRGDRSFLGIIFALSGFLLIGPPSWVADPFRRYGDGVYLAAVGFYLLLVGSLLWSYLRTQRQHTMIYNLNPEALPNVLRGALEELHIPYQATAGRIALGDGQLVLEVEASAAWYSATLTWLGPNRELREQIEARLREDLNKVDTTENPCRVLLILWGISLFAFSVFGINLFIWYRSMQG